MSWKISSSHTDDQQLLVDESIFFTGNGYLGVRGNFEEGVPSGQKTIRGTYINAFHDTVPISYGEKHTGFPNTQQKLLNIIDAQTIEIFFGTERFSLAEGKVISFERHLHLDKGFTERIIEWQSPSGKQMKLTFKRLVSFHNLEVFSQRVELESANYSGSVRIAAVINGDVANFMDTNDPRVASGHTQLLHVSHVEQSGEISYVECETTNTKLKTACAAVYSLDVPHLRKDAPGTVGLKSEFFFEFTGKMSFERRSIFVDTLRHGENLQAAAFNLQHTLAEKDFLHFLQDQTVYLERFWKQSDIVITGDTAIQEGIRFNLFSLLQSTGRDHYSNIAAKGLSGEGYEGHYFWDTEIYMFPVFLMTQPDIAKRLLLYRYSILDGARNHAKEMGHRKGALYPWRTISGSECSSYFPSGSAQYHISADIAYSFIQYYLVTADYQFIKDFGAEVLFETARLWLETGHFDNQAFKIDAVTGPDEYTCIVNNNYYTNVMAKHNLQWAVTFYQQLEKEDPQQLAVISKRICLEHDEINAWEKAAQLMYLPYDPVRKINPQDDTFLQKAIWDLEATPKEEFPLLLHYHPLIIYRYQVCKQADTVLAHFLLEDEQSLETIQNSYNYYEKITTHDSSLSSCIFSIMASKLGYSDKAYQYFIETARLDLDNTHGNTKDGLHMANMGGTWMSIVFGFAGLRIKEEGISFAPTLPDNWEKYQFTIQYRGRRIQLEKARRHTIITLLDGDNLAIKIDNKPYHLSKEVPIII
ncbi:glycoside hydrolase family 65 protein [Bacillus rubiinfantis]|uniref:glycoside hydrolase family 65 protein n=1 Tax=Bacillus rubiinfantis TaxID=1499680 RepID=UPI0005A72E47|nr:glycosyl hydrolase family 65 protein [Bacillus rubiinfantis]